MRKSKVRKALLQKKNEQNKNLNHLPKADTTRASAASGKAGARNTPDKKARSGISKGWGAATELLVPLNIIAWSMRKPDYKGASLWLSSDTRKNNMSKNLSLFSANFLFASELRGYLILSVHLWGGRCVVPLRTSSFTRAMFPPPCGN